MTISRTITLTLIVAALSIAGFAQQRGQKSITDSSSAAGATRNAAGGTLQKPNVDFNGDGRTDFTVIRPVEPGPALAAQRMNSRGLTRLEAKRQRIDSILNRKASIAGGGAVQRWFTLNSAGGVEVVDWGLADTDITVNGNFDGDTKDDYIVWRPTDTEEAGAFLWINSSDSTFGNVPFGLSTDDVTAVADWDGDGTDDLASFRCPLDAPDVCSFWYQPSSAPEGPLVSIPWGFGTQFDFFTCVGYYDFDAKADPCIQREDPVSPGAAQFILGNSGAGTVEYISWGSMTDRIVPGDFDGDGRSDLNVMRDDGSITVFYILERDGNVRVQSWGATGDEATPGDYDGDGTADVAIWRPSTGDFWILRSTGGVQAQGWGLGSLFDVPVAGWAVQ